MGFQVLFVLNGYQFTPKIDRFIHNFFSLILKLQYFRSGILDRYEKLLMYLFPYGWKVTTPATEESGMYVVRLFGLLMAAVLLFDVLLAWHVTELAWGNTLFLLTFFGLLAAIIALILAISRQPQIRWDFHKFQQSVGLTDFQSSIFTGVT